MTIRQVIEKLEAAADQRKLDSCELGLIQTEEGPELSIIGSPDGIHYFKLASIDFPWEYKPVSENSLEVSII